MRGKARRTLYIPPSKRYTLENKGGMRMEQKKVVEYISKEALQSTDPFTCRCGAVLDTNWDTKEIICPQCGTEYLVSEGEI